MIFYEILVNLPPNPEIKILSKVAVIDKTIFNVNQKIEKKILPINIKDGHLPVFEIWMKIR